MAGKATKPANEHLPTKEEINGFFGDPNYLRLVEFDREQRLLFITDLTETRVSSLLAWLLRPHEGHGLNDLVVRQLLINAWKAKLDKADQQDRWPTPSDLRSMSFQDLLVRVELEAVVKEKGARGRARSVDVVAASKTNNLLVAIENKFGAGLSPNQLEDYSEGLSVKFHNYRRVLVYLDSDSGREPPANEWIKLDYGWLIELLQDQLSTGLLSEQTTAAMEQFLDYLSESVDGEGEHSSDKEALIEQISKAHPSILIYMRDQASKLDWESFVKAAPQATRPDVDQLNIEYLQRRRLWRHVLESHEHIGLKRRVEELVKKRSDLPFSWVDVIVQTKPSRLVFELTRWRDLLREPSMAEGFRVAAIANRTDPKSSGSKEYHVRSAVLFSDIKDELKGRARDIARKVAENKRSGFEEQTWVQLIKAGDLGIDEAAAKVVEHLSRVQQAFAACGS